MRPSRGGLRSLWLSSWRLAIVVVVVVLAVACVVSAQEQQEEEKVTWTANPMDGQDDGGGPLPLSTKQRNQLLELENTIRQSPDPTATLQKVAAANNMNAQDLANILQRNRSDWMQSGGGGFDADPRPLSALHNPATRLLGAVVTVLKRHPKPSAAVISTLFIVWYLKYIEIPRTGLCLSKSTGRSSWFTRGTTTILPPPQAFVERLLRRVQDNNDYADDDNTSTMMVRIDDQYRCLLEIVPKTIESGQVQTIKAPGRKTSWKRAYVAEQTISLPQRRRRRSLLTQSNDNDEDGAEESNDGETDDVTNDNDDDDDVEDILLDQASRLLTDPSALVEWIPGVRIIVSTTAGGGGDDDDDDDDDDNENGDTTTTTKTKKVMLIYPGFGDFRRYALLSFIVVSSPPEPDHQRQRDDDQTKILFDPQQRLILQTTKGTYFDGQLVVDIIAPNRVRVSMIVERGRAPPKTFLLDMANSIAKSVQARTCQVLARRVQSARYRASSHAQMVKRRAQRDQKAREMEEMNADRRRKWQRSHPNAKHNYRPSGQRMRSPNNAIYQ
jgi:hypothetical protein